MPQEARQPNWFLRDGESEVGPLSEVELRARLAQALKPNLARLQVRQGNSDWHPATRVLARFKELVQNGVYLKLDDVTQGPFTPERAAELLRTDLQFSERQKDALVRVGRYENWQLAGNFLRSLDQLLETKLNSKAIETASNKAELIETETLTPLAKAVLIEEPTASDKPTPVVFYKASLVSNDKPAGHSERQPWSPGSASPSPPALPQNTNPQLPGYPLLVARKPGQGKGQQRFSPAIKWGLAAGVPAFLLVAAIAWVLLRGDGDRELAEGSSLATDSDSKLVEPTNSSLGAAGESLKPPVVSVGMLFRPKFLTTEGPVEAGSAFAARLSGSQRPIILSALHLFGPAGGMNRDVPPQDLATVWKSLELSDCVTQRDLGTRSGRVLTMAGSRPFPESSEVGDVIAYMPDSIEGLSTFPLATTEPSAGDRVWLVSEVVSGPALVHGATVEGFDAGFLVYKFDDRTLEIIATSGAPVLNAKHQVVAVNSGGGELDGAIMGLGTPTSKFYEPLARAAGLR